jgi:serine/threonine protein kinase
MGNSNNSNQNEIIKNQAKQIEELTNQNKKMLIVLQAVYERLEFDKNEKRSLVIEGKEYILKEKLGQGGFGMVYKAAHNAQVYAIKQIALSEDNLASIKAEMNFISQIKTECSIKHLPVINIYGVELIEKRVYYVMELASQSLQSLFDKLEKASQDMRLQIGVVIFYFVLRALLFLQSIDVVHSDIKPDNFVVIDDDSSGWKFNIKLIDFGTVKHIEMNKSKLITDSIAGTLLYLAPEAFKSVVHKKSDIWSLGIMLYQLIYSDFPFYTKSINEIRLFVLSSNELTFPKCDNEKLIDLIKLAKKCLIKDLNKRSSASDLFNECKSDVLCREIIPYSFVTATTFKTFHTEYISRVTKKKTEASSLEKACFICKSVLPVNHKYERCDSCFKKRCLDCYNPHSIGYEYARCFECFKKHKLIAKK